MTVIQYDPYIHLLNKANAVGIKVRSNVAYDNFYVCGGSTLFTYCIRFKILIIVDEKAKNSIKKCSV